MDRKLKGEARTNKCSLAAGHIYHARSGVLGVSQDGYRESKKEYIDVWEGRVVVIPFFKVLQFGILANIR